MPLTFGSVEPDLSRCSTRVFTDEVKPLKSNGRLVRTSITPAVPPSTMSAPCDLYTSTRCSMAVGMSARYRLRPTEVNISRPLSRVTTPGKPRMMTPPASPPSRRTCTPVTRPRISATFLSGNLPISSATMESTTWSLFFLIVCALCAARRTPVTATTAMPDVSAGASAATSGAAACVLSKVAGSTAGACCAQTDALLSSPAPASAATVAFKVKRVFCRDVGVPVAIHWFILSPPVF
ncbi:hypothetical protein D3C81_396610 [compost metagenome]